MLQCEVENSFESTGDGAIVCTLKEGDEMLDGSQNEGGCWGGMNE